ncbi:MAG: hypothetical protein ABL898_00885 [Hyphomicrobiaceae bacterium]
MSTIIESYPAKVACALSTVICGWFAIIVGVTVVAEPTKDVVIFGNPQRTLALLDGTDLRIVNLQSSYLIVRGAEQGFVRALYANGAWLVLPARGRTCFALRELGS